MSEGISRARAWLTAERLSLREFDFGDLNDVVTMHRDRRVRATLVDDYPLDFPIVAYEFIRRLREIYREQEGLGYWAAEYLAEFDGTVVPRFAGWFNLMPMLKRPDEIEIGSRLLPQFWGKGLAIVGGEHLLRHAFTNLGRQRVWAASHVQQRSVRYCVLALGFEDVGIDDYDGQPAQYFVIDKRRWLSWQRIPRRNRQLFAVRQCREHVAQGQDYSSFGRVLSDADDNTAVRVDRLARA